MNTEEINAIALAAVKAAMVEARQSPLRANFQTIYVILATFAIVLSASWFLYGQIHTRATDKRVEEIVKQGLSDFKEETFTPLTKDVIKINTQLIYIAKEMKIKLLDLTTVQSLRDSLTKLVAETNKLREKEFLNQIEQQVALGNGEKSIDEAIVILAKKIEKQNLNQTERANILYLSALFLVGRDDDVAHQLAIELAKEYFNLGFAEGGEVGETMTMILGLQDVAAKE